mmetsp:Transcript_43743/g.70004  ORF Transcript_43743/g.70004 Transcript_43743/m.70004 type:complete len:168 (+) Transcript_43743:246-749(+)
MFPRTAEDAERVCDVLSQRLEKGLGFWWAGRAERGTTSARRRAKLGGKRWVEGICEPGLRIPRHASRPRDSGGGSELRPWPRVDSWVTSAFIHLESTQACRSAHAGVDANKQLVVRRDSVYPGSTLQLANRTYSSFEMHASHKFLIDEFTKEVDRWFQYVFTVTNFS